jgi:hypothetical protein
MAVNSYINQGMFKNHYFYTSIRSSKKNFIPEFGFRFFGNLFPQLMFLFKIEVCNVYKRIRAEYYE